MNWTELDWSELDRDRDEAAVAFADAARVDPDAMIAAIADAWHPTDQVKALLESGDMLGAQRLILGDLFG